MHRGLKYLPTKIREVLWLYLRTTNSCTFMHSVLEFPSFFPFFSCRFWKAMRKKRWLVDLYRCGIKLFFESCSLFFGIPARLRLILKSMLRKVCWPFKKIKVHIEDWRFCFVSTPRDTGQSREIKNVTKRRCKILKTHQEHYVNKLVVLLYIANLRYLFHVSTCFPRPWRKQSHFSHPITNCGTASE